MSSLGDVPEGYKRTEVGIIPEDWSAVTIGSLQPFVTSGSRGWAEFYSDQGDIFFRIANLSRKSIYLDLSSLRFVELPIKSKEGLRTQLQEGDVLISITADIGISGYISSTVPKPAYINQHIALVRFDRGKTDSKYISYFLASETPQKLFIALTDSGAKAGMNLSTVQKICLSLPPTKTEQTAIANVLNDADTWIQSLTRLIAKKRQVKQGAMQNLLNPYENGCLKTGWVEKKLGDVGVFSKGAGVKKDEASSGILPCIRYGEIYTRHTEYIKCFNSFISQDVAATAKQLKMGDLLFAGSGETKEEIGKCVAFLNDFEAYAGGDIVILSPTHMNSQFLGFYLNTGIINRQKASKGQGDAVVHISATALGSIDLILPDDINEQTRIATILTDIDNEITFLETKLTKAQKIKQGMMQNLLTGRIRLI